MNESLEIETETV